MSSIPIITFGTDPVYAAMVASNISYTQAEWAMSLLLFPDWDVVKRVEVLLAAEKVTIGDLEEHGLVPEGFFPEQSYPPKEEHPDDPCLPEPYPG